MHQNKNENGDIKMHNRLNSITEYPSNVENGEKNPYSTEGGIESLQTGVNDSGLAQSSINTKKVDAILGENSTGIHSNQQE